MRAPKTTHSRLVPVASLVLLSIASRALASVAAADDPLGAAVEAARRTHDEKQLQSVKRKSNRRSLRARTNRIGLRHKLSLSFFLSTLAVIDTNLGTYDLYRYMDYITSLYR